MIIGNPVLWLCCSSVLHPAEPWHTSHMAQSIWQLSDGFLFFFKTRTNTGLFCPLDYPEVNELFVYLRGLQSSYSMFHTKSSSHFNPLTGGGHGKQRCTYTIIDLTSFLPDWIFSHVINSCFSSVFLYLYTFSWGLKVIWWCVCKHSALPSKGNVSSESVCHGYSVASWMCKLLILISHADVHRLVIIVCRLVPQLPRVDEAPLSVISV